MKYKSKVGDIGIGVLFTLFFISLGVILVINFRGLYKFDVKHLNIAQTSGYSEEEIMDNYNALIDYCSPFYQGDLTFPTMEASESGLFHFKEVKDIFVTFYGIAPITGLLLLAIIIYKCRKKETSYLFTSSITCILLPTVVALACAINFDKTFVLFHKLFFNNDYWLFDPVTDPIITVLPEEFFLHCAIFIVIFVILCSLGLFLASRIVTKRNA